MVIGQASNTLFAIVDSEVASHQPLVDSQQELGAVNIISNDLSQRLFHKSKQHELVYHDWRDSNKIPNVYSEYQRAFLNMLKTV